MSEESHLSADLGHEGQFALERRGYSRMQVDEAVAQLRLEIRGLLDSRRDLEERLSRAFDETERLKLELSAARSSGRPPHQEISERIGQILKLADDEAKSQRTKADEEIATMRADAQADTTKLRADVKAETDRTRAEAQGQAERMLSAAQEQAETTIATAKAEADSARKSAATEAQQVISEATKHAETAVATAKSQAKQQLDEATARATAIHDGAERRLNLLMSRHTETLRRLTEIRDVVTTLVAGDTDRGSLEDEVARIVAGSGSGDAQPGSRAGNGWPATSDSGRHASGNGQPEGHPSLSTAQRPGMASSVGATPLGSRPGSAHSAAPGSSQHEARPQPVSASSLHPGSASPSASSAGPAGPAGPATPAGPASAIGPVGPAGSSVSPRPGGSPASGPAGPPASAARPTPASRSSSRPAREVDDTAADIEVVTDN